MANYTEIARLSLTEPSGQDGNVLFTRVEVQSESVLLAVSGGTLLGYALEEGAVLAGPYLACYLSALDQFLVLKEVP